MSVSVKIKPVNGGINTFLRVEQENLKNAQHAMGDAIWGGATLKAPEDKGNLKSDGRVEIKDTIVEVVFGDKRVPYARRRHFENRKNPQTLNYLKRSGDAVVKEGIGKFLRK